MLDATVAVALDDHNRDDLAACGSRWAVCQTHPQAERWALANLLRQGFMAYLPLTTAFRRDRATPSMRHRVQVPLWTGYLFVVPGSHWAPIRSTAGVARLLMAGNHPHYLIAGAVEAVEAAMASAASGAPETGWAAPGVACSLATGAFQGLPAVVLAVSDEMATISVMFLGQLRQLTVAIGCLSPRE